MAGEARRTGRPKVRTDLLDTPSQRLRLKCPSLHPPPRMQAPKSARKVRKTPRDPGGSLLAGPLTCIPHHVAPPVRSSSASPEPRYGSYGENIGGRQPRAPWNTTMSLRQLEPVRVMIPQYRVSTTDLGRGGLGLPLQGPTETSPRRAISDSRTRGPGDDSSAMANDEIGPFPRFDDDDPRSNEFYELVYKELRHLAHRKLQPAPPDQSLHTTALVNEALERLLRMDSSRLSGREHFMAIAAKAMRSIIVDHARRRQATPDCGAGSLTIDELTSTYEKRSRNLAALDDALVALAERDPLAAKIVELRFFGRFDVNTVATALGISVRSVEREWQRARGWLRTQVS